MRRFVPRRLLSTLMLLALAPMLAAAAAQMPPRIVAAENFYGDIAAQLEGPGARVVSVLSNAAADPHLFEPDIATARAVAEADLVIYNGLSYDVWMERLLAGTHSGRRRVVVAASVAAGSRPGLRAEVGGGAPMDPGAASGADAGSGAGAAADRNPHLWYDPAIVQSVARAITAQLDAIDPAGRAQYDARLRSFLETMRPLETELAQLRARFAGTPVAATEPLAQYLTDAIGLRMSNERFQIAVMNDTEPSARDTAAFERSLEEHRVRVLIYNRQVTSSATERLLGIARQAHIPIVGMTETEPPGVDYQHWMLSEARALGRALRAGG